MRSYFRRTTLIAAALGVCGLVLNLLATPLFPEAPFSIGNIFVFLSASTFGFVGAIVSAVTATLPTVVLGIHEPIVLVRVIGLSAILGYVGTILPQASCGSILLGFWAVLAASLSLTKGFDHLTFSQFVIGCHVELFTLAVSRLVTFSPWVWEKIVGKLRSFSGRQLLPESLFIGVGILVGLLLSIMLHPVLATPEFFSDAFLAFLLIFLGVCAVVPSILGNILTKILVSDYDLNLVRGALNEDSKVPFAGRTALHLSRRIIAGFATDPDETASSTPEQLKGFIPPENGVIALTRSGSITFLNRRARHFADIVTNDAVGKMLEVVQMNELFKGHIQALLEKTLASGPQSLEFRFQRVNDGPSQFFELTSQLAEAMPDSSLSSGGGIIILFKDITDRRTVESHILEAKKVESLGNMVGGVAHSFNDSLTVISGLTSLEICKGHASDTLSSLRQILETTKTSGELVRTLLDFAQGSSSPRRIEKIDEIISASSEFFKRSIGDAHELELKVQDVNLPISCDKQLLIQALTHLILNAKESYSGQSGVISLEVAKEEIPEEISNIQPGLRPGTFARVRIKDEGSGMSAEVLARAFDPLFSTKRATGHTGLGLSVVFAVVRAHDGFLTAESHLGKGSLISLYFPLDFSKHNDSKKDEPESRAPKEASQLSVLLVEDDPTVLQVSTKLLTDLGYSVTPCVNSSQAFEELKRKKFDLFVIDMVLPGMNGVEAAKSMADKHPEMRGVIMSGYLVSESSIDLPVVTLRKPFDREELRNALLKCRAK